MGKMILFITPGFPLFTQFIYCLSDPPMRKNSSFEFPC